MSSLTIDPYLPALREALSRQTLAQWDAAEAAYREVLARAPRHPMALQLLARIFHRSRATNEYGIALVCPKIQVSNLDQRAGNAEAKLYRRN